MRNHQAGSCLFQCHPGRTLLFICFTLFCALLIFIYLAQDDSYPCYSNVFLETFANVWNLNLNATKCKRILLWTRFFSKKQWIPHLRKELHCPVDKCEITTERELLNVSDAVVFHWWNLADTPGFKPPHQVRILFNEEPPPNTWDLTNESVIQLGIDWSATYRKDSDFYVPYGKVVTRKLQTEWEMDDERLAKIRNKTKMSVWLVSNCNAHSHREAYVQQLQQYIEVDVFGKCGNLSCSRTKSESCWRMFEKTYKFYLAFENSICKDYITEKAMNPLNFDIIPVVLGGANYSEIMPPNSYIDALNFSHPRDLATYLKHVANDLNLYQSYFAWKRNYTVEREKKQFVKWACDLCERLHELPDNFISCAAPEGSIESPCQNRIIDWWYEQGSCKPGKDVIFGNTSSHY